MLSRSPIYMLSRPPGDMFLPTCELYAHPISELYLQPTSSHMLSHPLARSLCCEKGRRGGGRADGADGDAIQEGKQGRRGRTGSRGRGRGGVEEVIGKRRREEGEEWSEGCRRREGSEGDPGSHTKDRRPKAWSTDRSVDRSDERSFGGMTEPHDQT